MNRVDDGFDGIEQGKNLSVSGRAYGETCSWPGCGARCMVVRPDGEDVLSSRAYELVLRNGWLMLTVERWLCPEHGHLVLACVGTEAYADVREADRMWRKRLRLRALIEYCTTGDVEKSGLTPG